MTTAKGGPRAGRPGRLPAAVLLLLLAGAPGCGKGDGLSLAERAQKPKDDAKSAIEQMGGVVTVFHHPLGDGWSVNLSGAQISDDLFDHLKALGRVAELDLSRSTVTDEQVARLGEPGVGNVLTKLDLSQTAVTDAGLGKLTGLGVLTQLKLVGTKVTPQGVERFKAERDSNPNTVRKGTAVQLR
jgi:hypothetical protein